ncbi:hypothetical protein Hanom_Chr06g00533421 [Helianthus anomalus]
MEKIKSQLKNVVKSRQSTSSDKVLEEINILRAGNNNIIDALGKLVKEWAALKEHNKVEFAKVQEEETRNAQLMGDVQPLMKRMHYNVARLAQVDIHEIMTPIPKEASHLKIPKSIRQQPSVTPASQLEPHQWVPLQQYQKKR